MRRERGTRRPDDSALGTTWTPQVCTTTAVCVFFSRFWALGLPTLGDQAYRSYEQG